MISYCLIEEKHHKISSVNFLFTDEEKLRFQKMSESPTIWDDLSKSFAPSIY
jgi:DNA replicative helicase MCM subunit Mcm2 (Cdc46/Mcm family)